MKKGNVILQILKMLGAFLISSLLWLIIFSTFMPADETGATTEPFPGAICTFGIITALIFVFIINFNSIQRAFQKTKAAFSNITIFKERTESLLDKANRVADKYMSHEESIQIGVAEKRTSKVKVIRNAEQFQMQLENYPDLKANQSIMELLAQIEKSENAFAQSKINYNDSVEHYNTLIHTFPNNILTAIFKYSDFEFYSEEENEISDEDLGI